MSRVENSFENKSQLQELTISSEGKNKLDRKVKAVSDKYTKFRCEICQYDFDVKCMLNRHIRCVHQNQKPFKCEICHTCFGQQSTLNIHARRKKFIQMRDLLRIVNFF